jgi:hypothetical protein
MERRSPATPQSVSFTTIPEGATATLDRDPDQSCLTPCTLTVTPGIHQVVLDDSGFHSELRELRVDAAPVEFAPVELRLRTASLLVTSDPPGARIWINGVPQEQMTPASIQLLPGDYEVTAEKNGRRETQRIQRFALAP